MWNAILAFLIVLGAFLLEGALMLLSARMAKVEKRSFQKAVLAYSACIFANIFIAGGFHTAERVGVWVGIFITIWLQIAIIKTIFSTETGKAVITLIFDYIANIIIVIIYLLILYSYFIPGFSGKD